MYLKVAGSYDSAKASERDYLTCDENGFAQTKDMPYGIYTVHQVSGWEGSELMPDFDVFISQNGATYRYLINNAPFNSFIKIVKQDAETGKTIPYAGAGFKIYDPDGNPVTMTFTYPTPTTIDVFYTNADGFLVTPEKLPYGKGYHSLNTDENAALPKKWDGIKEKDMIGIPWQLAFALRADGWYLRSDIIWQKPNCLPEAVKDRPTKSYEHIFLLSKSPHYYYDTAAISEPVAPVTVERNKRAVSDRTKYAKGVGGAKPQALFLPRSHSDMPTKRNKRDVWSVSTNSHRGYGHFAMYPERLIEPCILAGSPEQGLVLDPFFGSGTTGAVCKRLSRRYLGIELNPEYCETAKTRIQQTKEELYLGSKNQP